MPRRVHNFSVFIFLAVSIFCLSCGGGGNSSTKPGGGSGGGQGSGVQFTSPTAGPTIELGQTVTLTVSAPSGSTITWTLKNGTGLGNPQGTLTANGTSATYMAPPLPNPPLACTAQTATPLQESVTASDGNGDSAELTIVILQALPCIVTSASVQVCQPTANATTCSAYPPAGAAVSCPPAGSLIPPLSAAVQSGNAVFTVGTSGSLSVADNASGATPFGLPPFTWSVSGNLPAGLSLVVPTTVNGAPGNGSIAFIQGTPTSAGCSPFKLQITDSLGVTGSEQFFVVVLPTALSVESPNAPTAYAGGSYYTALTAIGGQPPYAWWPLANTAAQGNATTPEDLPPNLTLTFPQSSSSNATVEIAGSISAQDLNPPNNGTYPLNIQVNDSQQPYPAVGYPDSTFANINVLQAITLCSPANPLAPPTYGGNPSGGSVPLDAFFQGSYAFVVHGFDANGPVAIAGSVQADGAGHISGGEEDVTRSGGSQTVTVLPAGSSYTIGGENNRGCIVLNDSSGATLTFAFTVGECSNNFVVPSTGLIDPYLSACGLTSNGGTNGPAGLYTSGRIIEFDSSGTHLTGILRKQNTSSFSGGLSGQYAFGLTGWDSAGKHYAAAGSVTAASGNFSAAAADLNDGGTLASTLTGGTGTVGTPDGNGRASASLTVGSATFDLAAYVVSANEVMLASTDLLSSSHPVVSGEAITATGPFSTSSLQNTHMFHIGGVVGSAPDVAIGSMSFDGISDFTGTVFENDATTLSTDSVSGVYAVDPNSGRTTFSTSQSNQNFDHPFVAYIIPPAASLTLANCAVPASCVTGFIVGTDASVQDGELEFQTPTTAPPPPFNTSFVLGTYSFGVDEALDNQTTFTEGYAVAVTNKPTISPGHQDLDFTDPNYCLTSGCQMPDVQFAGNYTINTNGTGTFGGANGETVSVTNGRVIFYFDQSPGLAHPSIMVAEQ